MRADSSICHFSSLLLLLLLRTCDATSGVVHTMRLTQTSYIRHPKSPLPSFLQLMLLFTCDATSGVMHRMRLLRHCGWSSGWLSSWRGE